MAGYFAALLWCFPIMTLLLDVSLQFLAKGNNDRDVLLLFPLVRSALLYDTVSR